MKEVIIRKPTDDEQRVAKIVTSDYHISALTIHSSILSSLGFVDKVYRAKETIVKPSNKKSLTKFIRNLNYLMRTFGYKKSPIDLMNFNDIVLQNKDFVENLRANEFTTWSQLGGKNNIPSFAKNYHTVTTFLRAVEAVELFFDMFEEKGMQCMEKYKNSSDAINTIAPILKEHLNKCIRPSEYGHSQTVVWQKAFAKQKEVEKELGVNFTPKMFAEFYLSPSKLKEIENEWEVNLLNYDDSWAELCNHLYSPKIISKIRGNLNVNVRSRSSFNPRKGVESSDKKKFAKLIEKQMKILGENFNKNEEELKLIELEKKLTLYKSKYLEAKLLKKYANFEDKEIAEKLVEKYKNKFYYLKSAFSKAKNSFDKKVKAVSDLELYKSKMSLVQEIIDETRSGEEISMLEQADIEEALNRQKMESEIPYCTWRFVCDKINKDVAQKIESVLEEHLNKSSAPNGEDNYINVTSFPMEKSFEFFVDYPKSSSMFKAFKNKGKELSKILIEGVANHLGIKFVCCEGETFVNSPMEKTMGGDMLEWIGL